MSELAFELIEENKRTRNSSLNLLYSFDVDYKLFESLREHIWLENLTILNIDIDDYSFLWSLKNLQVLALINNRIENISFVEKLISLQSLDLSRNYIEDLSFLSAITNLQSLNLAGNQIRDIRFVEKLTNLQSLNFSHNQIKDVNILETQTNLQELDLSNCEINDIDFLGKLTNLQVLKLHYNEIENISSVENLKSLKKINLSNNKVKDISFLSKLVNLEILDLDSNNVVDINYFDNLKKLQSLNLIFNKIEDIKPLSVLRKNGLEIDLNSRAISEWTNIIGLCGNPITTPPIEIVAQGTEAVINWFDAIEQQGEEMVYEAKLMVIGDAGSGKTSLATKIKDMNAKLPDKVDDTTVGIEISESFFKEIDDKPNFKVNIWDLGGQKIYQPLHQLFFTRRSLYVLVSDGRNDTDENDLTDFWIPAQELLGKESPMLILFNKHGEIQPNMAFRSFQSHYPNIKGDLAVVDLLNDKVGTSDFVAEIEKYMRNLPQFVKGEKLPKLWAKIREAIHQRKENYISLPEFRSLCSKEGIEEYEKQDFLSDYLHDLGIILRFREDPLLNKTVFLSPRWALDAIYKVLDHTRQHNNGLFSKSELLSVWQKPEFHDVQDELLALMLRFELCYKIDASSEKYLVPSLLPKDIPPGFTWNKAGSICLYYEYDFMPKGIISRLIVRLNHLIDKNKLLWREGVVFESNGTSAWLTKPNKNRIEIYAKGYKPSYLITLITSEIDEINSKYHFSEQSIPTKHVPCICEVCQNSKKPAYYDYEKLVKRDQLGKRTIECENPPYHEVNVKALLENVESKELAVSKSTKKVFVSYSKADEDYKKEFINHLSPLKKQIAVFDDRQIILGNQWREEIHQQIDVCDYFVCLVSVGFLNTDYIHNEEIPRAIEKGKRVILVIIKPCVWHSTPIKDSDLTLGDINAHNKGMVIGVAENDQANPKEYSKTERDHMWVKVVEAIQALV